MKIVKNILSALFGLMFLNAGLDKFFHYNPMPKMSPEELAQMMKLYEAFGTIKWLMPLVGFIEVLGGLLFIFPKTRALGAIVILPVMVGIVLHNAVHMPSGMGMGIACVMLLINIWMIADNWKKYQPMVA
ncbi:DoxX family protein [Pedobacter frigoris]|uniref:DoxX family protein n=1 Tax=Pedobacter frigoris TaxID=2571272 RepID=UPI00292EBA28|nr:DoxX family protein [Pedobacter frigoris]